MIDSRWIDGRRMVLIGGQKLHAKALRLKSGGVMIRHWGYGNGRCESPRLTNESRPENDMEFGGLGVRGNPEQNETTGGNDRSIQRGATGAEREEWR